MIICNVPSRTGMNVTPNALQQLCDDKNIVAIKEANGDVSQIVKIIAFCGDKLEVYF